MVYGYNNNQPREIYSLNRLYTDGLDLENPKDYLTLQLHSLLGIVDDSLETTSSNNWWMMVVHSFCNIITSTTSQVTLQGTNPYLTFGKGKNHHLKSVFGKGYVPKKGPTQNTTQLHTTRSKTNIKFFLAGANFVRNFQQTRRTYSRNGKIQIWKDSLHK